MIITKCLCVENGVIGIVNGQSQNNENFNFTEEDVSIDIAEYGLILRIKDFVFPVPESILDHLIKTGNVFLYGGEHLDYQIGLLTSIALQRDALVEAKGAFYFFKNNKQ